jgi:hypothetical protein
LFTFYSIGGVIYYKYVFKSFIQGWGFLGLYTSNWASFIQGWGFLGYSFNGEPPTVLIYDVHFLTDDVKVPLIPNTSR